MTAGQLQSQVPKADINRSSFNRSHGLKTTFDVDKLVPIFVDEVLPGDTHKLNTNIFARLATPINPIMDNMYLDTFYFFVPMRLVWDNYAKFFGEQTNPGDSTDYVIPTKTLNDTWAGTDSGSLIDYMGIPINKDIDVNCLPLRAYHLIYDEWFRDQNLQESAQVNTSDNGTDIIHNNATYDSIGLHTRGKRHDYFTSCLPWAQKGDTVQIPLGEKAFVTRDETSDQWLSIKDIAGNDRLLQPLSTSEYISMTGSSTDEARALYADLSQATASSINDWRQAFQIQRFLERDARGGTRYTEKVKAHFGVTSPDSRLQRPEYLGGGTTPVNIHPVAQQSSTDSTSPQGNLSAFGTASENNSGFTKSFTEHGYIIGLANVRADLTYQQGLDKMWSRETQYDFFFPTFAHLGEQAVLNKEIFVSGNATTDNDVFGYQERYAEYKYKRSQLTGLFRSDASASLDAWHLSEDFANTPTLGDTFIKSNTPLDRAIAVPSEPHFIMDAYFNLTSIRPMPVFSPPGMIDHF